MTAVATEPLPLLTKLIPVPRLNEAARDKEFRELAMDTEATGYSVEVTVRALCHPTLLLDGGRAAAIEFGHYRNAVLAADRIQKGSDDGHGYSSCAEGHRTNALLDMCDTADWLLNVLLHGHVAAAARSQRIHTTQKAGA